MKKLFYILFLFLVSTLSISAQTSGKGVGIILGEPTGLSGKMWLNHVNAINAAAAWSFDKGALRLQADYVTHFFEFIDINSGQLPVYIGIGGHLTFAKEFSAAVRIPVGLNYMFDRLPIDVFIEAVPGLALAPSTEFYLAGGLGIRYFFEN